MTLPELGIFRIALDDALKLIGEKAIKENKLRFLELAARRMYYASNADSLWQKCVIKYLTENTEDSLEKALNAAEHIKWKSSKD